MIRLAFDSQAIFWALVTLLAAAFYFHLSTTSITRDGRPLRKPPNTLPLLGNGILFLQPRQKLFAWFVRCELLHGHETLAISVPSLPPGVIVSDPRNLDFVFRNEGVFDKGDFFKRRSLDLFGHGIINVDGPAWRAQRRAGLRFLAAPNLRALAEEALPRYLRAAARFLEERADGRTVVDLQNDVLHEVTTQLMGRMAYDMEMHAGDDFTVAFEYASGVTAARFQNPLWFVTEMFTGRRFRKSVSVVKSFGRRIVARAVADREAAAARENNGGSPQPQGKHDGVSGSLIRSLLDAIGDEQLVADAALNYLSAGRDTVAQALTWTFYLLMKHPDVLEKLRRSIRVQDSYVDDNVDEEELLRRDLAPENMIPARQHYAMAVFYESLRLYPPVPFEIKQAQRPTILPDGTALPQGAVVVWCPWAMNRSVLTWGPDADRFRPERWLDDEGRLVARGAAEFPVFNGGPRLCLGKKMAELVAVQVVATLATAFEFEPAFDESHDDGEEENGGQRMSRNSLTLPMEGGLPVYVRIRASG